MATALHNKCHRFPHRKRSRVQARLEAAAESQALQRPLAVAGSTAAQRPLLAGVRVVLCSPSGPRNIGATLRVAANFEADPVYVVSPRCDPRAEEVAAAACLDGDDQLVGCLRVVQSLPEALEGAVSSVGFTRRAGAGRVTHPSLRALLRRFPAAVPALLAHGAGWPGGAPATAWASDSASASGGRPSSTSGGGSYEALAPPPVALVFGREESGLLDGELALCGHACAIPTGAALGQPSMNLSHAVAVVLAQLYEIKWERQGSSDFTLASSSDAASSSDRGDGDTSSPTRLDWLRREAAHAAPLSEVEALLGRLAALLHAAGVDAEESRGGGDKGAHGRRVLPMGHMRRLLLRSQASVAEVRAMHGIVKRLAQALDEAAGGRRAR